MTSSERASPSSFTEMDTSVSDCDAIIQVELAFGDKVPMMDQSHTMLSNQERTTHIRDTSLARDVEEPSSTANMIDDAQDPGVSDVSNSEDYSKEHFQPLVYAQQHGLLTGYFRQNPLDSACIPTPPPSVLAGFTFIKSKNGDVDEEKALTQKIDKERWNVDKDTAQFLTSVMVLSRPDEIEDEYRAKSTRDLKIEESVLSTDPHMDLAELRARNTIRLSTRGMEPCEADIAKGEGLLWAPADLKLPSLISESIAEERLDVDKETVELLHEAMQPPVLDRWEAVELAIEADKSRKLRRETTPLLPLSAPLSSSPVPNGVYEMDLTSSPADLFAQEAARVGAQLFDDDNAPHKIGSSSTTFDGQDTSNEIRNLTRMPRVSSSSPLRSKRLRDLKTDTPLFPQDPDTSPAKKAKTVSFPQELHILIPAPDSDDSITDPELTRRAVDAFVTDVAAPMAQIVIDQIENEHLDQLDTTLRVSVPEVDDVKAVAPWGGTSNTDETELLDGANKAILSRLEKEVPSDRKKWSGLSKLEQMMSWTPFPRYLGKVNREEHFDDGSCERYLAELNLDDERNGIEVLLWKLDGLRLLDPRDSDDEELEAADIEDMDEECGIEEGAPKTAPAGVLAPGPIRDPEQTDLQINKEGERGLTGMQALLQRRKLELEAASTPDQTVSPAMTGKTHRFSSNCHRTDGNRGFIFADSGLRGFLGLQGAKTLEIDVPRMQAQERLPLAAVSVMREQPQAEARDVGPPCILPAPTLSGQSRAMSIVVSSSMLANRQLVRQVQAQLPALELIERVPISSAPPADASSNAREADFTLSPSTGLICTTLQKLKQRPLPGQSNFFGIRKRIASVSPQYERCIVLVSEGRQDDLLPMTRLDERDATAIIELIGFANSLGSSIEVCYAVGGDLDLAKWVAASICRFSSVHTHAKLFHEETMWERVLRTAGTNPAAAQVILGRLKRSGEDSEGSSSHCVSEGASYGLDAFLQMSVDERLHQFGPSMGGEEVLTRINQVLDGGWQSLSGQ